MAHSTGGLITPYYLDSKKGKLPVDGLILNSPFLDWNFGWMMEKIVIPVVSCIGKLFPNLTVQGYGDASYAHSLLKQFKGEWVYNTDWKMINGPSEKSRMDKRHTRSAENSAERDRPGLSGTGDVSQTSRSRKQKNGITNICLPTSCWTYTIFKNTDRN